MEFVEHAAIRFHFYMARGLSTVESRDSENSAGGFMGGKYQET